MTSLIRWEESNAVKDWTHGYVGDVRAFTIEGARWGGTVTMQVFLPNKGSANRPNETCKNVQAARDRAEQILAEFLAELGAHLGPPRRSS